MHEIIIGRPSWRNISAPLLDSMYALRHEVFKIRLGWEVDSQNGREKDWFDRLEPTYVVARHDSDFNRATGSSRLLPTQSPYMLKDVFPQLLNGHAAPQAPNIWEVSRFAVARPDSSVTFGMNETPASMIGEIVRFVRRNGVDEIVTVTSVGVERLLRSLGLKPQRFGPALQIGNVRTVALRVPMDDAAEWALWGCLEADLAQQQAAA